MYAMRHFRILLPLLLFAASLLGENLTPVSIQLNWKHQFEFAGMYIAREKGYYTKAGLDVTIKEFNSSVRPVQDVLDGVSTFGVGYSSVILDRMQGKDIVLLSAFLQTSPHALMTLTRSGIHAIRDFKGRSIMIGQDARRSAPLLAMLADNHVPLTAMHPIPPSFDLNDLITGKVDIITVYTSNEPFQLKQRHIPYTIWNPKDYGIDVYGDLLYTSEAERKNHPETVQSFEEATRQGWLYAYDHIPETVDLILRRYNSQHKTREALLYEARVLKGLAFDNTGVFGTLDQKKIEETSYLYHRIETADKMKTFLYKPVNTRKITLTDQEKSYLAAHPVITAQNETYWPPYNFMKKGMPRGFSIDYMNLLAAKLNIRVRYVQGKTWSQYLEQLKNGSLDVMLNIRKTREREKYIRFTAPYIEGTKSIFTNLPDIHNLNDLNGKTVAVPKGYYVETFLRTYYPQIQLLPQKNTLESLMATVEKRADAMIEDYGVVNTPCRSTTCCSKTQRSFGISIWSKPCGWGFRFAIPSCRVCCKKR